MSIKKSILLVALISFSAACGFFIGQNTKSNTDVKAESQPVKDPTVSNLIKILDDAQIRSIGVSENDDDEKRATVIRKVNKPCAVDDFFKECEKFIVYDESGKIIFEYKDFGIIGADSARLINPTSSQIILETNSGGTDDFLHIFDYKGGKYSEVIDPSSDFLQIRGGYFTMLQYRTEMEHPYFKPSQLIAIQQIGGADNDATTSVIRFQNGKLRKVGEFSMQKLGDFIEQEIGKKH